MKIVNGSLEPCQCEYEIKCKVVAKSITVHDEIPIQGKIQFERRVVYLVPEMNDEGQLFLRAWLPETVEEHFEIAMFIKNPIFSPCRGAVRRSNLQMPKHHIYVMSKGIEEEILRLVDSGIISEHKKIIVTVYSETQEDLIDGARDSTGDFDVI